MTRPELHALVDIVMDAREEGFEIDLIIGDIIKFHHSGRRYMTSSQFETFSDFTKAVQEYIKTLETK